jgi:hypothetical protein
MARKVILSALAIPGLILSCTIVAFAQRAPAPQAGQTPLFRIRAQVVQSAGNVYSMQSTRTFSFRLSSGKQTVRAPGNIWSQWLEFTPNEPTARGEASSNQAQPHFPIKLALVVSPVADPTPVKVQVDFSGAAGTVDLHGDLFGPNLGLMVWREAATHALHVATMAGYNRRYWHDFDAAAVPVAQRPKHFLIVDRFIGGDNDRLDWQEGISHLAKLGITATVVPPLAPLRGMLLKAGLRRILLGGGIAGGPLGLGSDTAQVDKWSSSFADRYLKAGFQRSEFSLFALADEPGWYYPSALQDVDSNPALLQTFRHYLAERHLTPSMLGAVSWAQVHPIGHGEVSANAPLPTRRLFYWTCRFFPWYAAEHMRAGTEQLHQAFTPELKTFANWNNFAGQFYFEGFPANNPNRHSADAAMASPDWFESGRIKATDLLWTEDWFGNNRAWQWSFYASKLRSIAYQNGLDFGGYVIGRTGGEPLDGYMQKVLTLIGSGAKAVFYYNFGPEYNFPGNCYSEVPGAVGQLARADRMIAEAEDVLWPGREPQAQVAILDPRSSEVWDGRHIPPGSGVVGATNNNLNGRTMDYIAEEFDEYHALQMSDVPADFVSEDGLTDGTLSKYKVLYITEPDIPREGQEAIVQWVKSGGTLAMVPGAAEGDRYDEAAKILTSLAGSPPHRRAYIPTTLMLNKTGTIGNAPVFGDRSDPASKGKSIAFFSDHSPAVMQTQAGKGNVFYFSFFPGISFGRVALDFHLGLRKSPEADSLRNLVLAPVQAAQLTPPVQVDSSYVETPMLVSRAGAAITLLNWTGAKLSSVRVKVREPFRIGRIASAAHGSIKFRRQGDIVTFALPLGAADIVRLTH